MAKTKRDLGKLYLSHKDCADVAHAAVAGMAMRKKTHHQTKDEIDETARSLISRIYEEVLHEASVVFVGAGCTTEGHHGHPSFYEEIRRKSGYPSGDQPLSFPEMMEFFCKQIDGGQHNRLIREAVARIERFAVPGHDNYLATMFGEQLAEIPYFSRFVTTNWDPFLERSLEILIPMIEDRDLAFWDDRRRQVLKIHGCITRPYSLVATQTDYENCLKRNRLIFNKLKDLMATKTFIFVGYSLRDPDFRQVWEGITKTLGRFAKLAYGVDLNTSDEDIDYWKKRGIEIFRTTGLAFVEQLRARLVKQDLIPSQHFLDFLQRERQRITKVHINLSQTSDGGFASAMYQDGLLHALTDVLTETRLGTKKRESFQSDLGDEQSALEEMWKR